MTRDEFMAWVNRAIGYQARVITEEKAYPQPQRQANPFGKPVTESDKWYPVNVKVGIDVPTFDLISEGTTYEMVYKDVIKRFPNIAP